MSTDRAPAIREAVAKAAREKRRRELRIGTADMYTGHYRGRGPFFLEWVAEEYGYRKHVEQRGVWRWEDPTILSTAEVERHVQSGAWKRALPEQSPYPGPLTKMVRAARNGSLTKGRGDPAWRTQRSRSDAPIAAPAQSEKFSEALK